MRVIVLFFVVAACTDGSTRVRGGSCETDLACAISGASGKCQPTGFCSYADATCVDGFRYSPLATGMENACVGGDVATCGLAEGDACCAGGTCGANLACTDGACVCGSFGEPCCDGATCDGGAACTAGTCGGLYEQVAVGRHTICAVYTDGKTRCWGENSFPYGHHQPGQRSPTIDTLVPTVIANATNVEQIKAGEGHVCVRKTDKTLWCWGHGTQGQLGDGAHTSRTAAVQVTGLSNVSEFSVGRQHTCAIGTVSGTQALYCWGHNGTGNADSIPAVAAGRLGNGTDEDSAVPVAVDASQMSASGQTIRTVVAGGHHTCAVTSDNKVWCWGVGQYGTLGNNTTTDSLVPMAVDLTQITIPNGVTIDELSAPTSYISRNGTCMRLSNGTVYCWGRGRATGDNDTSDHLRPTTPVSGSAVFTKLGGMPYGNCGVDDAHQVWCWGQGTQGQLGNASTATQGVPALVVGLPTTITAFSTGHHVGCVIDGAKHLWCWGANRKGVISRSRPTTDEQLVVSTPVEVLP